jgi:hypothetical protein
VPTRAEIQSLANANNRHLFSKWTTKNGVEGRLFGDAPNQIFLPVSSKRRWNNGNVVTDLVNGTNLIKWGFYWSSTKDTATWAFIFDRGNAWATNNRTNPANGKFIRCVSK